MFLINIGEFCLYVGNVRRLHNELYENAQDRQAMEMRSELNRSRKENAALLKRINELEEKQ